MNKRVNRVRLVLLGCGIITAVALLVATRNRVVFGPQGPARVVRTPNGCIVRLEGYHFRATNFRYDLPRGILPKIGKLMPGWLKARFRDLGETTTVIAVPHFPGEAVLSAAFSVHEPPGSPGSFSAGRVVVADDGGQEFDPAVHDSMLSSRYSATEIQAFPRRGKELHLRLMDGSRAVAEFTIPNPAPGPHPIWTAKPLPIAAKDDELEVSLVQFRSFQPGAASFSKSGIYPRTECSFQVREDGHDSTSWRPAAIEISDATGNHWRGAPWQLDDVNDHEIPFGFYGALWPQEDAWKLRVEFRRIADFPEKDVLRIKHLPIPGPNELLQPKSRGEAGGAIVEVAALIGAKVPWNQINRLNADRQAGCVTILVTGQILSRDRRLNVLGATDDRGRELKLQGEPREPGRLSGRNPDLLPYSFNFKPADDAMEFDLVLGISRSRYLEFLAKPEQVQESERQTGDEGQTGDAETGR